MIESSQKSYHRWLITCYDGYLHSLLPLIVFIVLLNKSNEAFCRWPTASHILITKTLYMLVVRSFMFYILLQVSTTEL